MPLNPAKQSINLWMVGDAVVYFVLLVFSCVVKDERKVGLGEYVSMSCL